MDGTVTAVNVELGERVVGTSMMTGTEILRIADLSRMEVVVEISENDIVNLALGDSAKIEVDALPDSEFYGKVSEIAYSAQTTGLGSTDQVTNFEVKIAITPASYRPSAAQGRELPVSDSPFRPGMTALVDIYTDMAENVVAAPIQAITLRDVEKAKKDSSNIVRTGSADKDEEEKKDEVVFVVNEGVVSKRIVRTDISDDNYMVITEGLEEGEKVVTGPYTILTKKLKDGDEVKKKFEKKEDKD